MPMSGRLIGVIAGVFPFGHRMGLSGAEVKSDADLEKKVYSECQHFFACL